MWKRTDETMHSLKPAQTAGYLGSLLEVVRKDYDQVLGDVYRCKFSKIKLLVWVEEVFVQALVFTSLANVKLPYVVESEEAPAKSPATTAPSTPTTPTSESTPTTTAATVTTTTTTTPHHALRRRPASGRIRVGPQYQAEIPALKALSPTANTPATSPDPTTTPAPSPAATPTATTLTTTTTTTTSANDHDTTTTITPAPSPATVTTPTATEADTATATTTSISTPAPSPASTPTATEADAATAANTAAIATPDSAGELPLPSTKKRKQDFVSKEEARRRTKRGLFSPNTLTTTRITKYMTPDKLKSKQATYEEVPDDGKPATPDLVWICDKGITLTMEEKDVVANGNWLNDSHILLAMRLLIDKPPSALYKEEPFKPTQENSVASISGFEYTPSDHLQVDV